MTIQVRSSTQMIRRSPSQAVSVVLTGPQGPAGPAGEGGGGEGTVTAVNGVEPVAGEVTLTAANVGAATAADVAAAVAALVDSSPGTLDTLNELAAALADDPNFAATMTAALAAKADSSALGAVATSNDYGDLDNRPTLGTAAAEDATDFAASADTAIECIWTGAAWTTLSGGAVPTGSALIRHYSSTNDAAADEPTAYNVHDTWTGVTA